MEIINICEFRSFNEENEDMYIMKAKKHKNSYTIINGRGIEQGTYYSLKSLKNMIELCGYEEWKDFKYLI